MTEPRSNERPDCSEAPQGRGGDDARQQLVARLFQEHNDALLRFLAVRLHSHQEAKEVAQEAYVKLLNLDQPEAISYQRAFLFKIAANLAIDRLRGGGRRERARQTGLFTELNEVPTPEHEAAIAQQVAHLEKLIAQLPAKCRQAFLLYKIQGLDFFEVAQRMNLSERMVRDYVMRAIVFCRVGLDQEFPHG